MTTSGTFLTDSSTNGFTVTNNNGATWSSATPFNKGSGLFNGTNQYLTVPSSTAFNMGSGDFTAECWVNTSTVSKSPQTFMTTGASTDSQGFWLGTFNRDVCFLASTNGGASWNINIFQTILNANAWTHIAGVRSGNTFKLYVNGTAIPSTGTASGSLTNTNNQLVVGGQYQYSGAYYTGYLTNVRVVKGVAVYTSNFTPPTATLTATQSANTNGNPSAAITGTQSSVVLGMTSSGTFLTDSSTNGFTVTNNNGATWNFLSPLLS
jgi:hypothetical protein